jgi:hypothetical protein
MNMKLATEMKVIAMMSKDSAGDKSEGAAEGHVDQEICPAYAHACDH